jgi:hypothetical protein
MLAGNGPWKWVGLLTPKTQTAKVFVEKGQNGKMSWNSVSGHFSDFPHIHYETQLEHHAQHANKALSSWSHQYETEVN